MKKSITLFLLVISITLVYAVMKEVHVIDKDACTACNLCVEVCEDEAISVVESEGKSYYVIDPAACTNCGLCVEVCEDEAISVQSVELK